MRGKLLDILAARASSRITPADAGKTSDSLKQRLFCEDHPRGCGENQSPITAKLYTTGSPPRMRGKPVIAAATAAAARITPADAGKTKYIPALLRIAEDHPRGCGENPKQANAASRLSGSPPRMRGKPESAYSPHLGHGITPADAGKTVF